MGKILVTGSNGFIGKRLTYLLLEKGHEVYALTRMKGTGVKIENNQRLHLLYGDLEELSSLDPLPQDIDAAYYLVHSMASQVKNLINEEKHVALNFLKAIEKTACQQIIFLSGIIEDKENLSPHLQSRLTVEKTLQEGKIPTTTLRSSIILGAGSASFEIIRDLVEKLPVMIAPRWVKSICQPIAIHDVLFYLEAVLLNRETFHQTYDIGGPEVLTFKEVLLRFARFRKLKRLILDVPVLTPRLSSYWLVLVTSVRYSICSYLIESMKQNTRKLNCEIDKIIPHSCLKFEQALKLAFQKIDQNEVVSTWMDAWNYTKEFDIQRFITVPEEGCLKDVQNVPILIPIEKLKDRIWSLGGHAGWYSMNWAWKMRGQIDQLVGGTGLNRGRRDPHKIEPGDSIDFWRVILANADRTHLILYAEMKLPGEAWLEFVIDEKTSSMKQIATFRPKGFWGRFYWYALFPIHWVIFRRMARAIAQSNLHS